MSILDPSVLNTLRHLLGEKLNRIVAVFAQQLPATLQELQALHAQGNCSELAVRAHAFKGSCANLGAADLSALAAAIERAAKLGDTAALQAPVGALADTAAATLQALRDEGYWST